MQLDGTIIAPTDSKTWGKGLMWWIDFTKLKGIKVQGKGVIDGRGSGWWQQDSPFIDSDTKLIVPLNNSANQNPPMPVSSSSSSSLSHSQHNIHLRPNSVLFLHMTDQK